MPMRSSFRPGLADLRPDLFGMGKGRQPVSTGATMKSAPELGRHLSRRRCSAMAINAVIQARAGSTRLPTKVLADLGGRPVLEWVVRAAQGAAQISTVIVAALRMPGDDVVVDFAQSLRATVVARTTCFPASCRHWMPAPQTLSYR